MTEKSNEELAEIDARVLKREDHYHQNESNTDKENNSILLTSDMV